MSMTLNDMATEVARRALGGQATAGVVDLARASIKASIRDWNAARDWYFLLKDTSTPVAVTGTGTAGETFFNSPSTGALDFVNVGQIVTESGGTLTLPSDPTFTYVLSIVRNASGVVTSINFGDAAGAPVAFGGTGTNTAVTLTFSANIPIRAGVNEYNLPTDFRSAHSARLLTDKRLLAFIRYREWNRKVIDQDTQGAVEAYTTYNPVSADTQNYGTYRMRVFRTPSAADTLHMQYFRPMNPDATTVDIPDAYVEMFIDYAIWRLVRLKNTEDTRLPHLFEVALGSLQRAITDDTQNNEDEEVRLISQMEAWGGEKMLWSNGPFWPLDY